MVCVCVRVCEARVLNTGLVPLWLLWQLSHAAGSPGPVVFLDGPGLVLPPLSASDVASVALLFGPAGCTAVSMKGALLWCEPVAPVAGGVVSCCAQLYRPTMACYSGWEVMPRATAQRRKPLVKKVVWLCTAAFGFWWPGGGGGLCMGCWCCALRCATCHAPIHACDGPMDMQPAP